MSRIEIERLHEDEKTLLRAAKEDRHCSVRVLLILEKLVKDYNVLAMRLLGAKRFNDAVTLLSRANCWTDPMRFARFDSLRVLTYGNLACCFHKFSHFRLALESARQAVRTAWRSEHGDWDDPAPAAFALLNLCTVLSSVGLHEEALLASQRAIVECRNELRIARARLAHSASAVGPSTASVTEHITVDEQQRRAEALWEDRMGTLSVAYHNLGAELEHLGLPGGRRHFQRAAVLARRAGPSMQDFAVACRHAAREADEGAVEWSSAEWSARPRGRRRLHRKPVQRELDRSCSVDSGSPCADTASPRHRPVESVRGIVRELWRLLQLRGRPGHDVDDILYNAARETEEEDREGWGKKSGRRVGEKKRRGKKREGHDGEISNERERWELPPAPVSTLAAADADQVLYRLWGARALMRGRGRRPWVQAILNSLPEEFRGNVIDKKDGRVEKSDATPPSQMDGDRDHDELDAAWVDRREPCEATWQSLMRRFHSASTRAFHARQAVRAIQAAVAEEPWFRDSGETTKDTRASPKRSTALSALEEELRDLSPHARVHYLLTMISLGEASAHHRKEGDQSRWFTIGPSSHSSSDTAAASAASNALLATKVLASGRVHWIASSEGLGPNPPALEWEQAKDSQPTTPGEEADTGQPRGGAEQLALTLAVSRLVRAWRSGRTAQWQLDDDAVEAYMEGRSEDPANVTQAAASSGAHVEPAARPKVPPRGGRPMRPLPEEGRPARNLPNGKLVPTPHAQLGTLPVRPVRRSFVSSAGVETANTSGIPVKAERDGSGSAGEEGGNEAVDDREERSSVDDALEIGDGGESKKEAPTAKVDHEAVDEEPVERDTENVENEENEHVDEESDGESEAAIPYTRNDILNALLRGGGLSSLGLEDDEESSSDELSDSSSDAEDHSAAEDEVAATTTVEGEKSGDAVASGPGEDEEDGMWAQDRMLAALMAVDRGPSEKEQQRRKRSAAAASSSESPSEDWQTLSMPAADGGGKRNSVLALKTRLVKRSGKRKMKRGWAKLRVLGRLGGSLADEAESDDPRAANETPSSLPRAKKASDKNMENSLQEAVMVLRVVRRLQRKFRRNHPRGDQ